MLEDVRRIGSFVHSHTTTILRFPNSKFIDALSSDEIAKSNFGPSWKVYNPGTDYRIAIKDF
jgi:hypothetical protein